MYKKLDPLLHSELRLSIISLLVNLESAEFVFLKEKTKASAGNLSVQLNKLEKAGYISIEKFFKGKKPITCCSITKKGIFAFEKYVNSLKDYLHLGD
ncbi:MAG: transcriptional regulator [Bacteroidales bacterium]|jgi:predicted transcriptional regulator|nr:transcriptional regulator [Bacteroidales bacterium]